MMKLKYSICCGLDVHKNVIVATIVTTNKDRISEYKQKSFSTINSDIQSFTSGLSGMVLLMFVWRSTKSIGFLF